MFRRSIDALFTMREDVGAPVEAGQPGLFGGTVQSNSTDP
jgi:hypothetical protein